MKLLFLLIWRNNFTLFFVLLQSFCIYLIINNSYYQHATVLNATNSVVTEVMEGYSYVKEYIHLRENNENLSRENSALRAMLNDSKYDTDSSRIDVSDSLNFQQYKFLNAKVINNSINHRNNYLTLNKGSLQGVKPEMGVITSNGIVGIVKQVSDHYCTVMSFLHKDTRISGMIKRNKFFGSLVWDGENPNVAILNEIDKTVPVQKGDTIITTAYSAIFPAGLLLGTVIEAKLNPGSNFHQIRVKLSTRFDNLSYVNIVDNLMKNEQRELESNNKPDDK